MNFPLYTTVIMNGPLCIYEQGLIYLPSYIFGKAFFLVALINSRSYLALEIYGSTKIHLCIDVGVVTGQVLEYSMRHACVGVAHARWVQSLQLSGAYSAPPRSMSCMCVFSFFF